MFNKNKGKKESVVTFQNKMKFNEKYIRAFFLSAFKLQIFGKTQVFEYLFLAFSIIKKMRRILGICKF